MKILISGGSGFLGRALTVSFLASGGRVELLSRTQSPNLLPDVNVVSWDGTKIDKPSELLEDVDVIIQLAGKSLASWPLTASKKKEFLESWISSSRALVEAVKLAGRKPRLLIQQ